MPEGLDKNMKCVKMTVYAGSTTVSCHSRYVSNSPPVPLQRPCSLYELPFAITLHSQHRSAVYGMHSKQFLYMLLAARCLLHLSDLLVISLSTGTGLNVLSLEELRLKLIADWGG